MESLVVIFLTGLTAGGLSCLAVQGGMLMSSMVPRVERSAGAQPNGKDGTQSSARPILLFLGAKLLAYTALGAALGWLGSLLQLTPAMRAVLQIGIGLFMVGTALRLLEVHPAFRHFVIGPPRAIRRYIRRKTNHASDGWLAPGFLGALTVLIPCGVTQAMMALAVASGSPLAGASIMFAFVLGTTPLFFSLAYLATKLAGKWQAKFWKATGVAVLVLGLMAIDGGLALAGSPFASGAIRQKLTENIKQAQRDSLAQETEGVPAAVANVNNELTMNITNEAYTPAVMQAKAGLPIKLTVKTSNVTGCARALVIPSMNVQKLLGENDTQHILIPPQVAGSIRLTCTMGMYGAQIVVK